MRIECFSLHPVTLNWLFCDHSTIWSLCCSWMVHEIDWQLVTDVLGQPVGSVDIWPPTYQAQHLRRVKASGTPEWTTEISHCSLFCLCSFWAVRCDMQEFHSCEYWDNGVLRQERSLYPTDGGRCFLQNTLPIWQVRWCHIPEYRMLNDSVISEKWTGNDGQGSCVLVPVSMEANGVVELQLEAFLSLEPLGDEWLACPVPVLPLGKEFPVPTEYRAGISDHYSLIVHPVAWLLYWMSYPSSLKEVVMV